MINIIKAEFFFTIVSYLNSFIINSEVIESAQKTQSAVFRRNCFELVGVVYIQQLAL